LIFYSRKCFSPVLVVECFGAGDWLESVPSAKSLIRLSLPICQNSFLRFDKLKFWSVCQNDKTLFACIAHILQAQGGFFTKEEVMRYTPDWTGERFPDGRPKVPDNILDRMKKVTLEEAWATLRQAGFNHEYDDGWLVIHPDQVLVGRALTAVWMPGRPDIQKVLEAEGKAAHRIGAQNAWPVDMLQRRDVYLADHFGLKKDGPSIGDNIGNAIYARSGNGIVYNGAVSDIEGLKELPNFASFVRSFDPSHHFGSLSSGPRLNSTMVGYQLSHSDR
jgi:hypothetical protein